MKKFINFRPILFIALSLCCGIASAHFFMLSKEEWGIFFIAVFIIPLIIYLCLFTKRETLAKNSIFSLIFLAFFVIGSLSFYFNLSDYNGANLSGNNYDVKAKIVQKYQTETGHKFILDNAQIHGNRKGKIKYKISLYVSGESEFDIGDVITFNANLNDNSILYEDRLNSNDIQRGIKYYANVSTGDIFKISTDLTIFERINLFMRQSLYNGLDLQEFSVGYALLTGNSNFMDNDLISSYRDAGVAHIFAVSGLHIGFLASVLIFIFKKIRLSSILKAIIITLCLLFYSGVCGFLASSLRATVMISVMLFARHSGNRYDGLSAVSLSAILILLFSPVQLFCVGFQLSFMVVIGIIVLAKPLAKLLKFLPKKLAISIGTVVSAQIFSLPICLYAFGKFSIVSVIVNLIFIPAVSFIFILTLSATIIGGIFSKSNVLLFPSNYIFKLFNILISAFDYKIFMVGGFVLGSAVITYYLLWFTLADMFNLKLKAKLIISILLSTVSITTTVFTNCSKDKTTAMYVTSCDSLSATYISDKHQKILIVSDAKYVYSTARLKKLTNKTGEARLDLLIIMGGFDVNLQEFITKMTSAYQINKVYYFGERKEQMEQICKVSFPKITLQNFADGKVMSSSNIDLSFAMNGRVMLSKIGSFNVAVFSKLSDEHLDFSIIDNRYDVMVCLDRADALLSRYSPRKAISYKYSDIYQNAESYGNICLKIS